MERMTLDLQRRTAALLCLASAAAGCGVGNPDVKSGGDAARETAAAIELGKDVEDSVSFNDGDRTDWKTFEVPGKGKLVLDVLWGNASARCGFRLVDAAGADVKRFDDIGGVPRKIHRWNARAAEKYFLRFQCEDEGDYSAYMVKVSFTPSADASPSGDPKDDGGDGEAGDGGDGEAGDGGGAAATAKPAGDDELVAAIKTMKRVKKVTVLTIDKGSKDAIAVGMTGEIVGLSDSTFTVTKVTTKSCTAETALDPKAIGANLVVRFNPK